MKNKIIFLYREVILIYMPSMLFNKTQKKGGIDKVKELIDKEQTISFSNSPDFLKTGVIYFLKSGEYNLLDKYKKGLTEAEIAEICRESIFADVFLTSCKAITENGELYDEDLNEDKTATLFYRENRIIVVVGINKIAKDIEDVMEKEKKLGVYKKK
jgi:hypothetical protein